MKPRNITVSPLTLLAGAIALALVLTPAAYAAGLAKNSVGTAQLRSKAVTTPKLKKDAVTSQKIKNRSVKASDLAAGAVTPRPVVANRDMVAGESEDVVVAGVRYNLACISPSGVDTARLTMAAAVPPGTVDLSGVTTSATTTLPFVSDSSGDSSISAIPGAEAGVATVAFTGQAARADSTPSLVLATLRADDNAVFPCRIRLTVSPTR